MMLHRLHGMLAFSSRERACCCVTSKSIMLFLLILLNNLSNHAVIAGGIRRSPLSEHVENVRPLHYVSHDRLSNQVTDHFRDFHANGIASSLQIPRLAIKIHRAVVEGSADEGEGMHPKRALEALQSGSKRFLEEVTLQAKEVQRYLESDDGFANLNNHRELKSAKNIVGIILFTGFVTFLVVLVVTNLVAAATDRPVIPFFESPPEFLTTGNPGTSYKDIKPCNRVPLKTVANPGEALPPLYNYLPVTGGFLRNIQEAADNVGGDLVNGFISFFESIFAINTVLGEADNLPPNSQTCVAENGACDVTAQCCSDAGFIANCVPSQGGNGNGSCNLQVTTDDDDDDGNFGTYEPFCYLWSVADDGKTIDTLAFVPLGLWPPVKPAAVIGSVLPLCAVPLNPFVASTEDTPGTKCIFCEYHVGFPITEFSIGPLVFMITIQWGGVAMSWADDAKLAFGTNSAIQGNTEATTSKIWDGFRSFPLPEVPDINFWTQFTLNVIPLPNYKFGEKLCSEARSLKKIATDIVSTTKKSLALTLDFELYIGFDKKTFDAGGGGNATEVGESLAGNLGANGVRGRQLFSDGRNLWRDLQGTSSEDPCVIVTMRSAQIAVPLVGTLFFGTGVGGFCNFSPEETGVRCSPSGFFFNLEQEFRIEGGLAGILSKVFSENVNTGEATQASGNSIGVFQNADGENEAVVFRLEFPVLSLFGVTIPGSGRPIVHFQYIKGSEIERRRSTLLRTKPRGSSIFTHNCAQVRQECLSWAPFYKNQAEANADKAGTLATQTEICTDILLNPTQDPDKLLYYNRVLTAETLKDSEKWLITPPSGSSFKIPERYNFESNPDASVIIAYLALADINVVVISIRRISATLILSDRAAGMDGIDQTAFNQASSLFQALNEIDKAENGGFWQPPSAFNFPSLQEYLDYLPEYDIDGNYTDYEGAVKEAQAFNAITSANDADQMAVFVRVFCQISVLFFADISLGLIMSNFADLPLARNPDVWEAVGQFDLDVLGMRYSVTADKKFTFNSRRRLSLLKGPIVDEEVYHRALQDDGLGSESWNVAVAASCVPDSFCEAFVQFFEDLGAAIWEGMQAIGKFFTEDLVEFAKQAIAAIGEWGKKFIGGLIDFAKQLVDGIQEIFEDGEVAKLINGPKVEAFGDQADAVVKSFSDGKFTFGDVVEVGKLVVQGVTVAVDFIVAGVTDVAKAIGRFFENAFNAVGDFFAGSSYTKLRSSPGYTNIDWCAASCRQTLSNKPNDGQGIKENCWCMDEFECPVKIPQEQFCKKKAFCFGIFRSCITCSSWKNVPIIRVLFAGLKFGVINLPRIAIFPRFDGRKFDESCRKRRMAELATMESRTANIDELGKFVDRNFESNFKGLSNFSPQNRRARKLGHGRRLVSQVDSVSIPKVQAVVDGNVPNSIKIPGKYSGAQLSASSTESRQVSNQEFQAEIFLTKNPKFTDEPGYSDRDAEASTKGFQRGAATPFLDDLTLDDERFLNRQPRVEPPKLALRSQDPVQLDCSATGIADAWKTQLQGSEPDSMRRKRMRRRHLQGGGTIDINLVDIVVESILLEVLKESGVLRVTPGKVDGGGKDIFGAARNLLGTEGAGAFLDTKRLNSGRKLQSLDDIDFAITDLDAIPEEDRLTWRILLTATDSTGTSNPVEVKAFVLYGSPELANMPPTQIQTRCDTSPFGVEDLEEDNDLRFLTNATSFTALLRQDNCPNPLLSLQSIDSAIAGVPCTTSYTVVQRSWLLVNHETGQKVPNLKPMYLQNITLGGLEINGEPAAPIFNITDFTYQVIPEDAARIVANASDFFVNGVQPQAECRLCEVIFSHPQGFNSSDIGPNLITITATNSIGTEVSKSATAFVTVEAVSEAPSASPIETLLGSISGNVTLDINNDDMGNLALMNIPITLRDRSGVVLAGTFTDVNGSYAFYELSEGDYTVMQTNLARMLDVADADGGNLNSINVTLRSPNLLNSTGNNFIDELSKTISGVVSEDSNNGVSGSPLSGATLVLLDSSSIFVNSTITEPDGHFAFAGISPGQYTVLLSETPGITAVTDSDGGDATSISVDVMLEDKPDLFFKIVRPSSYPSSRPSSSPSLRPSLSPETPSAGPTSTPSELPTRAPSETPSERNSVSPSNTVSEVPTQTPSEEPTPVIPLVPPSQHDSASPSQIDPVLSSDPTSTIPTQETSEAPTNIVPSASPSNVDSESPSHTISSFSPSSIPTAAPTSSDSMAPSDQPTLSPALFLNPSQGPSVRFPSQSPSSNPSKLQEAGDEKCIPIPETERTCNSAGAKPKCTPFRSPDHCPADESFSLLIKDREMYVKQNLELLDKEDHWFQFLDDRGAAYAFTRSKGIPTPTIYCCIDDIDQLGFCFDNIGGPASNFVIHASGLHSNVGTFVFPEGFNGVELISGMSMDLNDVIGSLKSNEKKATKYIVEEFVSGSTSVAKLPQEYKLHFFNGKFGSATVMLNRGSGCECYLEVDENWARLDQWGCFVPSMPMGRNRDGDSCYDIDFQAGSLNPYQFKGFDICGEVAPPDDCVWETLLDYGRELSEAIGVYMRIDMFVTDDKQIYVQEYTRSHSGGLRHCAAKPSASGDGCVDSCFLGRKWKGAGGEARHGGPKLTTPDFLEGYHSKAAEDQCLVVREAVPDSSTQKCA